MLDNKNMLFITRNIIRKLPAKIVKIIPLPSPEIISDYSSCNQAGKLCHKYKLNKVLLITDKTLLSLGLHSKIIESLEKEGIKYTIFSNIDSEPNLTIIENGRKTLLEFQPDGIIALGGGAVMDSTKMIAAGAKLKKKKVKSLLKKILIIRKKTLPLITIPTTAGTGAEITFGAVVTNNKGEKKASVIAGLNFIAVILDGELMIKAPKNITCACAIDALSHGIEGVVSSTKVSKEDNDKSKECVKLVLENLPILIKDPNNQIARQNMCVAANYGGNAINKQLAGYVHAFAHTIGGKYHIPHGNAIALSLLPVMKAQLHKCTKKLADLSRYCLISSLEDSDEIAANKLLEKINDLIFLCDFPKREHFIVRDDYNAIAKGIALDSINYSSPMVFSNKRIYKTLDEINRSK